jgi:flagellar hook protein FlgE
MISSLSSAMSGMADATSRFDRASARIAQPEPGDVVRDRVDQIAAQHDFAANVATVRAADEMIGTLINIVA